MPAKETPRPFCKLDREYFAQDTIRALGQKFGATGPLVFLALILEAGKAAPFGKVDMRWWALATVAFTDPTTVQAVVRRAVALGLIDGLESDAERFSGRLTRYERWEAKDATAARRSANYRARQAAP